MEPPPISEMRRGVGPQLGRTTRRLVANRFAPNRLPPLCLVVQQGILATGMNAGCSILDSLVAALLIGWRGYGADFLFITFAVISRQWKLSSHTIRGRAQAFETSYCSP
jgi:hypothetical protein